MNNMLEKFLRNNKIDFKRKMDLSKFTYFKTGNTAEFVIYPNNAKELKIILDFLKCNCVAYKVIGATTNLLFLDDVKYDVLISLRKFNSIEINEQKKFVKAEAGVMLPVFVRKLANLGITGFEGLEGIPGTIGGAIYMNAGAYGYEIKDKLIKVQLLLNNGKLIYMNNEDLKFSFRHSIFREKHLGIITKAYFKAKRSQHNKIVQNIKKFKSNRKKYLEHSYPNLGSLFATFDIYSDIARHHLLYKIILLIIRKFIYKIIHPNDNKLLNILTSLYFGWNFKKQPYSNKTLNCIINKGIHTDDILKYIQIIKKLTKNQIKLENEILTSY